MNEIDWTSVNESQKKKQKEQQIGYELSINNLDNNNASYLPVF